MLSIDGLISGGIITNYYCTSSCRHCLYRCSPFWPKDYISEKTARDAFSKCRELGCRSVHVGGGEPFLNEKGLLRLLETARDTGVRIEYIETNSSWCTDSDRAVALLRRVRALGVDTLLISASPFHLEFIPFRRVSCVVDACRQAGIGTFIWTEECFRAFGRLQPERRYTLEQLGGVLGSTVLQRLLNSYWIHPGGRALETFFSEGMGIRELIDRHPGGCTELADTSHFHMDLYGNYVPGLCSGLSIEMEDLGRPLEPARYPLISILHDEGIGGLYRHAQTMGFEPERRSYGSKCTLCFEIRKFLLLKGYGSRELSPREHYMF